MLPNQADHLTAVPGWAKRLIANCPPVRNRKARAGYLSALYNLRAEAIAFDRHMDITAFQRGIDYAISMLADSWEDLLR